MIPSWAIAFASDHLEVLDSDMSQLLMECGNEVPSPITSTGKTMIVVFFSDYSENSCHIWGGILAKLSVQPQQEAVHHQSGHREEG